MLRIGYVRLRDADSASETAELKALGCHVVRAEEPSAPGADDSAVLFSILDFVSEGDELLVARLEQLGASGRAILEVLDKLDARGAHLRVLQPAISTEGDGGRVLRAALEAVAVLEPASLGRRRRVAPAAQEIQALQRAGVGPVEIARRLGVSRMTVWRKLKAVEA
ncbi:MAG: site-specific recombinase, invertase Pin-like protein [Caulobacteraceae bacterium]|nr:site-specific recombinase, invertase Pin-like protein [Caulobacteraceae bacterium]